MRRLSSDAVARVCGVCHDRPRVRRRAGRTAPSASSCLTRRAAASSVLAQILGTKLSEIVKQPVVIDNRPGAGGNIGSDAVAKSAPDGYTILLHTSALASAPALYKTLPFDVVKDFAPVTMVIATQLLVAGSPKNPATDAARADRAGQGQARHAELRFQRTRLLAASVRGAVQDRGRRRLRSTFPIAATRR